MRTSARSATPRASRAPSVTKGRLGAALVVLAGAAASSALLCACGTPTMIVLASHREAPDSVLRLMRGGARLGCVTPQAYDRKAGLVLECKEGRVVIGKRTGENRNAPGHPLQITCTRALAESCDAFYRELWKAGEAACRDDEVVAGCGALQCTPPDDAPDVCEKMTADN